MNILQRAADRLVVALDGYQQRHPSIGFLYAVVRKYIEDEAGHRAALLAYYGFLSLFPLLLVLATILKVLLHNNSPLGAQVLQGVFAYFPAIGHDLQQNIQGIGKTGIALLTGLLLTLFGARGVADMLRASLDHLWLVPHARRSRFPAAQLRSMAIIFVGGISLVLAPVVSGYAVIFGHSWFSSLLSALVITGILYWVLIYIVKVGTSVHRRFRDIWLGTLIAAAAFEILQSLGSFIVTKELQRLDNIYGAFALVLGLIFWLYLQTQIMFLAFEVDAVRVFHLWPRSMRIPLMPADKKAYHLYTKRATFYDPTGRETES